MGGNQFGGDDTGGFTHFGNNTAAGAAETAAELPPPAPLKKGEVLGASATRLALKSDGIHVAVKLDSKVRTKLLTSLRNASFEAPPDRVVLRLEGIKGTRGASLLQVFINLPKGARPLEHPELRAGTLGLFGLRQASRKDSKHAGGGLSFALDITRIVDAMHLGRTLIRAQSM